MARGVVESWSLEPIGRVQIGPDEYPVPPLTFGRFQRLLASDLPKLTEAFIENASVKPSTLAERLMARALRVAVLRHPWATRGLWAIVEACGLGKRKRPIPGVAEWVHTCVPSIETDVWRRHGDQRVLAQLFVMFAKGHDWGLIADALRFGEPIADGEVLPSRIDVAAGLLAVAKQTGYTIEALHEMRLDGFYLLVETLRQGAAQAEEPATLPPGIAVEDGDATGLLEKLRAAEGATDGD